MISALADAGAAFGRADYLAAAVACARVHRGASCAMRTGGLLRTFNRGAREAAGVPGGPRLPARGVPDALRVDLRRALVRRARSSSPTTILMRFYDPERGGFFSTAADHTGLIARRKDLEDAPIPSGASSACFGLLRLARMTGEARYEDAALSLIRAAAHRRARAPAGLRPPAARDRLLPRAGARGRAGRRRRRRLARGRARRLPPARGPGRRRRATVPLLEGREPVDGHAAAYVCERFTCQLPVTSAEALAKSLRV